jgi:endonuclease YncB( thermonuclease family)
MQNFPMPPDPRLRWPCAAPSVGCLVAICALIASADAAAQEQRRCTSLESGPQRTVARIIDGETVALDDGHELRLIGALAPRALDAGADSGAWPLEAAAREALGIFVLGKSITLGFVGERVDRYGRLQAHAYVIDGLQKRWVQGHMLEQGLARAYEQAGNRACGPELLAAEGNAREARSGMWAEAAYAVRAADDPAELLRYHARFQVVEGRVARVGQVRGSIYLNFGSFRRRAFFASLRDADRGVLGEHARNPKGLEGSVLRVRGWIERRRGRPAINLSAAGMIEVLSKPMGVPPGR